MANKDIWPSFSEKFTRTVCPLLCAVDHLEEPVFPGSRIVIPGVVLGTERTVGFGEIGFQVQNVGHVVMDVFQKNRKILRGEFPVAQIHAAVAAQVEIQAIGESNQEIRIE